MAPEKFIAQLFASRDMMHLQHLATTSYAEHKALDAYYSGILDLTDSFTEKYFGRKGRVAIEIPASKATQPREHLLKMQAMIESEMDNYASDLQNILQDMLGLVNETIYLLTLM